MFFPERIVSINPRDKVLEIGPGATPYFRSDVFLEKEYETEEELIAQSGYVGILKTDKRKVTYTGNIFPFADKEFDYVVCSHVLEHVENLEFFLSEIQRVSKKGYFEFPTVYYDYIYNFPEHVNFLFYKDNVIRWMMKSESGLNKYESIQKFFYRTCELEYLDVIKSFKQYFFQGFEWVETIKAEKTNKIELLTYSVEEINLPRNSTLISNNMLANASPDYANISLREHLKYKIKGLIK